MKHRTAKPATPKTGDKKTGDKKRRLLTEQEELRRRQVELDRQSPQTDPPDGLIVSRPEPVACPSRPAK